MKRWVLVMAFCAAAASVHADVLHDYEGLEEGALGETFTLPGVTYRDANQVSGFWPDGEPFTPDEVGTQFIIENAELFYGDFPDFGSPVNVLTFGGAYIPGPDLSLGALASVWFDLDEPGTAASLDLGYYENGPWGGIEYVLDAVLAGETVASDSFVISDLGGRDNPAVRTMSVAGATFDSLHLYAIKDGSYTVPRGIIDDLAVTAIPEPAALALLLAAALGLRRRNG